MEKETEKQRQFASKVLSVIKDSLVVGYPYLARAVYELEPFFIQGFQYGTDGKSFFCSPERILEIYLKEVTEAEEIFLHSVLHCLYLHPFLCKERECETWNLSCDIFVCYLIFLLDVEKAHINSRRAEVLNVLEQEIAHLSAQSIYRHLMRHQNMELLGMTVEELSALFAVDEHRLWYEKPQEFQSGEKSTQNGEEDIRKKGGQWEGDTGQGKNDRTERIRRWSDLAEYAEAGLAMNIEKRLREYGDKTGHFLESLRNICGENKKYSEFLKQFAVLEEKMLVDLDSFDYIYYTYGMHLYEDTPLIEPLEYKEAQTIHEFVVAIDTSGSCDRNLVRKFLMKTYDILSDVTIFDGELCVYILQCDAQIQQEKVIHNIEEMKEYAEHMEIYGRGGTDFRPVFSRVEELREEGRLTNVRGLLYFTDGYGTYPKLPTDYKTAFVFVEMDERTEVPSWAMKVYIEDETDL